MLTIQFSKFGYFLQKNGRYIAWHDLTQNQALVELARQDGTILSDSDRIKHLFKYFFESFSFLLNAEDSEQGISPRNFASKISNHYKGSPKVAFAVDFFRRMEMHDYGVQG